MYDPHQSPCAALDDTEANLVLRLSANEAGPEEAAYPERK
jgi:hypothetical protein